jgi:multimeric flavodoxin WrbA
MKVVVFDGSREPRGLVGVRLSSLVERLRAHEVEAELVRLEKVRFTGCTGCGQCAHRTCDIGCSSPPEDGLRRCVRKIKAADAAVIGTPVYGAHGSPATQQLLIRLEHDRRERGDTRLAGKPAVVVVGPAGSGAGAVAADVRRRLEVHGMRVADAAMPFAGATEQRQAADVDELAGTLLAALSLQPA